MKGLGSIIILAAGFALVIAMSIAVGELLSKIKSNILFESQTCYEIENGN